MQQRHKITLWLMLVLLISTLSGTPSFAEEPPPNDLASPPLVPPEKDGPMTSDDWQALHPEAERRAAHVTPQETGGPDDFGYTWDDTVAMNWIDASAGTNTGLNSSTDHVGPVDIGFPFKYYENTHSQLYISRFGFVAFNDDGIYRGQSEVPDAGSPNDVIAPHWVPAYKINGYVRYRQGGTSPNRWFVVEWNQLVSDYDNDDVYTFEVILHESGDITFQYAEMLHEGNRWCEDSGIEDSRGLDGFSITGFCNQIDPNHAVRIYRPAPAARIMLWPQYQGDFVQPGQTVTYQQPIYNTGELGSDTYDLTMTSNWPVSLYAADGTTPLSDTDGDGTLDTGAIPQGGSKEIVVEITAPSTGLDLGSANHAQITFASSVDPGVQKTAEFQTGLPTYFAQVFQDNADGAMSIMLARPNGTNVGKASADNHWGDYPAVAETPSGALAYAWSKGRSVDNAYVSELEYTLVNPYGNPLRGVTRLTDHSGATQNTYDYTPAVAVAPNGRIGIAWYTYRWNSSTYQSNYNIYFAILDGAGNLAYGPVNVTNNNAWGTWGDDGVPRFYDPHITATDDNRFVVAWEKEVRESGNRIKDVFYTIRDTNGGVVKGLTNFTNASTNSGYYYDPALTGLSGNRALLAYHGPDGISYAVLDSAGNIVKGATSTGDDGRRPDAVQMTNGNVLLAWSDYDETINFALLDGSTYDVVAGPTALNNPASPTGDDYVSVAADGAGHGVLTWSDYDYNYRRNLYYALIDGDGTVLTEPMIFYTSQATEPYLSVNYGGYGNTSLSSGQLEPPTMSDFDYPAAWSPGQPVTVTWQVSGAWVQDVHFYYDSASHAGDNAYAYDMDATATGGGRYQAVVIMPASGSLYFKAFASNWGGETWSDEQQIQAEWLQPEITSHVAGQTNNPAPTLQGKADPGTTVNVYKNDTQVTSTTAGADGTFNVKVPTLSDGQHVLTVESTQGGITSPRSHPLTLTVESDLKVDPVEVEVTTPGADQHLRDEDGMATLGPNSKIWIRAGETMTFHVPVSSTNVLSTVLEIEGPDDFYLELPLEKKDPSDPDLWSGEASVPDTGFYTATLTVEDDTGLTETDFAGVVSDNEGAIRDAKTGETLEDVEVTAWRYNSQTKQWVRWQGAAWGQQNPQTTSGGGLYQFTPYPAGLYKITAEKEHYWTYTSDPQPITGEPLRLNVELQRRYDAYLPIVARNLW